MHQNTIPTRKIVDINDIELYRNDDITINFNLPDPVDKLIKLLDDLYENKEDLKYNLYLNELNIYCKALLGENQITERQFNTILDRYGAW